MKLHHSLYCGRGGWLLIAVLHKQTGREKQHFVSVTVKMNQEATTPWKCDYWSAVIWASGGVSVVMYAITSQCTRPLRILGALRPAMEEVTHTVKDDEVVNSLLMMWARVNLLLSPVCRWPVHRQCLLPAADHSHSDNHPPGPSGSFLTPIMYHETTSSNGPDLLFNPSPLLNSVSASQLSPPPPPPGLSLHMRQSSNIESNMEVRTPRGESRLGLRKRRRSLTQFTWKTPIKLKAILPLPSGNSRRSHDNVTYCM